MSKNKNKNKNKHQGNQAAVTYKKKEPAQQVALAAPQKDGGAAVGGESGSVPATPSHQLHHQGDISQAHLHASRASLEQQRAAFALEKVKALRAHKEREKAEGRSLGDNYYVSYVSALPATIVMNGLGQALAMLLAKANGKRDSDHYFLYEHLTSWLLRRLPGFGAHSCEDFIEKLMQNDQKTYVHAQAEAMAYLHWLKQFARAYLKEYSADSSDFADREGN